MFSDSEWNRDAAWHLGLAAVQLLVVIGLAVGSGTFEMDMTARQFPGHLGPSGFIMVFGVSALCYDRWSLEARARFEGRAALGAAVTYIVGDAMMATGRTFTFYMQHGLHTYMNVAIGVCGGMLLLVPKLERRAAARLADLPHLWFTIAFSLFIYVHKQPNEYGIMMHWGATIWLVAGGVLRMARRPQEGGACYIVGAYVFFGGQMGFTFWASRIKADPGGYVLQWCAAATLVVTMYAAVFLRARPGGVAAPEHYMRLPAHDAAVVLSASRRDGGGDEEDGAMMKKRAAAAGALTDEAFDDAMLFEDDTSCGVMAGGVELADAAARGGHERRIAD